MVWPLLICPTCKGQKITMPDPEFGGDPGICGNCEGRGEVLLAYPPRKGLLTPERELTSDEIMYANALYQVKAMWELMSRAYCVTCLGHGHTIQDCPRRKTE